MTNVEMAIMARFNLTEKQIIRMKKFKCNRYSYNHLLVTLYTELFDEYSENVEIQNLRRECFGIGCEKDDYIEIHETVINFILTNIKIENTNISEVEDDNLYTYNSYGELVAQVLGMELVAQRVYKSKGVVLLRTNGQIHIYKWEFDNWIEEIGYWDRDENTQNRISGSASFEELCTLFWRRTTYIGILWENENNLSRSDIWSIKYYIYNI